MRWADTDSEDSDDEFQTAGSGVVNTAMIDLSVSPFSLRDFLTPYTQSVLREIALE